MIVLILSTGIAWPVLEGCPTEDRIPGCADALFFQYRLLIRDLLARRCTFSPSCSHFGQQAISRFGPVFGPMMALERWLRCHSSAGDQSYYETMETGYRLFDPLEVDEGLVIWDSLLLPF